MEKLLPGNTVMADQGFTIEEALIFKHAELTMPAFTKGNDQLHPIDLEKTKEFANVLIHAERIISLLRRKDTIL